jgi:hypothetical protein
MNKTIKEAIRHLQDIKENKIYSKYLDKYANKTIDSNQLHRMLMDIYAHGWTDGYEHCKTVIQ